MSRAVRFDEYGGADVLQVVDVAEPVPGPGELLIDVAATSVNRADLLQRQGRYAPPPGVSEILGLECAGVVAALGEGVTGFTVGDPVCALLAGGGYAEPADVYIRRKIKLLSCFYGITRLGIGSTLVPFFAAGWKSISNGRNIAST